MVRFNRYGIRRHDDKLVEGNQYCDDCGVPPYIDGEFSGDNLYQPYNSSGWASHEILGVDGGLRNNNQPVSRISHEAEHTVRR